METILCLPDDVAEWALENYRFLSVGRTCFGMVMPGGIGSRRSYEDEEDCVDTWLVLLEEELPEADAHSIVAHEIAHAWLKHDRLSPDCPEDCEVVTANLTAEWGFVGMGADADYCDRDQRLIKGSGKR